KIVEFVSRFQPKLVNKVKLYTKETPIFEEFGIQHELDKALRAKVWLKSGGYIVINHTEALVAIDVNTGKFVGKGSTLLEDTMVKSIPTRCYEIQAEARKMATADHEGPNLTVRVNPEIAKALKTRESMLIDELEQISLKHIIIQSDATLHWEQYDIY